jgi:hypothetical protein
MRILNVLFACILLAESCLASYTPVHSIGATFDGQGSALTAGKTVYFAVPFACSIKSWNMTVDTGTATVDVWKIASGTAIPTVTNSITASATPAITTGTALLSTAITTWTGYVTGKGVAVTINDLFGINLKVASAATEVSLVMECQ